MNCDCISFLGSGCVDTGWDNVSADVASDVVGCYIGNWGVGRWHTDGGLVTGRDAIDPKLMKVLVSTDCCEEGSGDDGFGEHLDRILFELVVKNECKKIEMNVVDHRSHFEMNVFKKLGKE